MESVIKPSTVILIMKPKRIQSYYELSLGDEVFGSISFTKMFGTLAEVKLFDEEWSLKRMGFWKPYVTLRHKGEVQDYMRISFSGKWQGLLSFVTQSGELYELTQTGIWNPKWVWLKKGRPLIEFDMKFGMKKYAEANIREMDELTHPLLMIGSYGLIMQGWDDGGTGAVLTAIIG